MGQYKQSLNTSSNSRNNLQTPTPHVKHPHKDLTRAKIYSQSRPSTIVSPKPEDIIISEWMGFYLLHESMLESVLIARDRFLRAQALLEYLSWPVA